jgi:phospholipid/cholesterol/gamma-HCH transport system ATP-binding protein
MEAVVSEPVIVIKDLVKGFGDKLILDGFSLTVQKGCNVVILGKSGSGKSVLIKCIIGLLLPDSGSIQVFNENILGMSEDELDKARGKIGFLFQSNALYDSMTIRENLEFPLLRHWVDIKRDEVDKLVNEALENVDLLHTIDMMPAELSGGMLNGLPWPEL